MSGSSSEHVGDFAWRAPAPIARRLAMIVFSWQSPSVSYFAALGAAAPFIIAALYAPAMLSLSPTVDMLAPIAEMRATLDGRMALIDATSPFYLGLLALGDTFSDAPGRIYLVAKAVSALLVIAPMAYFTVSRLPIVPSIALSSALAAYVASPFGGPAEFALALFLVCAFAFVSPCADEARGRARFEGILAGFSLFVLWLFNPVFSLAGFLALSACPFLSGANGLTRYASTLFIFAVFAGVCELIAPGINVARAAAASGSLNAVAHFCHWRRSLCHERRDCVGYFGHDCDSYFRRCATYPGDLGTCGTGDYRADCGTDNRCERRTSLHFRWFNRGFRRCLAIL